MRTPTIIVHAMHKLTSCYLAGVSHSKYVRRAFGRSRLIWLGVALSGIVVFYAIFASAKRQHLRVLFQCSDLRAALVYFAESNCGRLPDSPQELLELPYVVQGEDGTIHVNSKTTSAYYPKTYAVPIPAGWKSLVRWGAQPAGASHVEQSSNHVILHSIDSSQLANSLAKEGSWEIARICQELRNACDVDEHQD